MEQDLLTLNELAEKLKVKPSWIYGYSRRQTGPDAIPRIKVGKYLRFRLNEVMNWIEERQDKEGQ